MIAHDKNKAMEKFGEHLKTAKAESVLAGGVETPVDNMLDDLAQCLDKIYHTNEFSRVAVCGG